MDVSNDRRAKYGLGSLRLVAILAAAAIVFFPDNPSAAVDGWYLNAYLGSIGAVVNVDMAPFACNLAMLGVGALLLLGRAAKGDYATAVILLKTLGADALAGKIDTLEWRLSLAFAALFPAVMCCCSWWIGGFGGGGGLTPYGRILPALFLVQFISEYGDKHWEHLTFFRHRYAFEVLTLATVYLLPWISLPVVGTSRGLTPLELRVVWLDLLQCLAYRMANWAIIVGWTATTTALATIDPSASLRQGATLQYLLCWVVARLQRRRIMRVRDAAVARQVFRASSVKGFCLERCIATPAWAPILSLESVDGSLWRSMRSNFNALVKLLPPASKMHDVSRELAELLAASGDVVDARAVVKLTLSAFLAYLFDADWRDEYEVFAGASWEWRMEIAARGRADPRVKQAAVDLLVRELLPRSRLWDVFGDRWARPEYYSLILQPFLISPAINVSDIAVAMQRHPQEPLDAVIRLMHPIPILERFVEQDVFLHGRLVVPANTQVMIFPADLQTSNGAWNPFGEGPRQCPGAHLARPLLLALQQQLLGLPQFRPELHHLYSGRNNDDTSSPAETAYLAGVIGHLIARLVIQRVRSCFCLSTSTTKVA